MPPRRAMASLHGLNSRARPPRIVLCLGHACCCIFEQRRAALTHTLPASPGVQGMCERLNVPCAIVILPKSIDNDLLLVRPGTHPRCHVLAPLRSRCPSGPPNMECRAVQSTVIFSRRVLLHRCKVGCRLDCVDPDVRAFTAHGLGGPQPCNRPRALPGRPLQLDKCFGYDTAVEEAQKALLAAKAGASLGAGALHSACGFVQPCVSYAQHARARAEASCPAGGGCTNPPSLLLPAIAQHETVCARPRHAMRCCPSCLLSPHQLTPHQCCRWKRPAHTAAWASSSSWASTAASLR